MTHPGEARRPSPSAREALKTFAVAYPLSLLLTLVAACSVPAIDVHEDFLSFASVLGTWGMMAVIGVPSGLVVLLAVLVARPLRRLPFSVQTCVLAATHVVPLVAVIRLVESWDL